MAQNVILHGCDLERSRSCVKVNKFSIRPPPLIHKYMCEISLESYRQFFCYRVPIVDPKSGQKKRKKERRQNMTETL